MPAAFYNMGMSEFVELYSHIRIDVNVSMIYNCKKFNNMYKRVGGEYEQELYCC